MQSSMPRATTGALRLQRAIVSIAMSAFAVAASAATDYGNCEVKGDKGSVKLTTVTPGAQGASSTLTISVPGRATVLSQRSDKFGYFDSWKLVGASDARLALVSALVAASAARRTDRLGPGDRPQSLLTEQPFQLAE